MDDDGGVIVEHQFNYNNNPTTNISFIAQHLETKSISITDTTVRQIDGFVT